MKIIPMWRIGDFYEFFGPAAHDARAALGLTLTARNGVTLAGIPHHQADTYTRRALRAGFKLLHVGTFIRYPDNFSAAIGGAL